MTVSELTDRLNLEVVASGDESREVTGGYCGDLLSWVMGRAQAGDAWITVMGNVNAVAVAVLADVACILLAEDSPFDEEAAARAQAQQVAGTGDFFKDFRAQRETARADEIALLDGIVNRQGAPEESVREADARKIDLTRYTEQERAIEKLLVAKGFEDAAAFVQEDTVSIAVKKEKLSEEDTAKILELAMRQTDQPAENIKIIPVAPD